MNNEVSGRGMEKEDDGQFTNGHMFLTMGMLTIMPLLGVGLLGQSLTAITQGGLLVLLSLLALILGLGGLALSFSKVKNGFKNGAVLITVATILSFLFESIAVIPDNSHSMTMIMISGFFALFLTSLDFIMKQGSTKDVGYRD